MKNKYCLKDHIDTYHKEIKCEDCSEKFKNNTPEYD